MALSEAAGAAIVGGASLFGNIASSAGNARAAKQVNKGNMKLAEYQYSKNLDMWHMTNAYNSPTAQMQRLKAAGLNPNLVYGNGATTEAAKAPSYDAPNLQAYTGRNYGVGDAVATSLQYLQNQAQVENMKEQNRNLVAQNDVLRQQALTGAAQAANIHANTARTKFDLGLAETLKDTSVQAAISNVEKVKSDIESNQVSNTLKKQEISMYDLKKQLTNSQINQLQVATKQARETLDISRYENDLKKIGIYPHSNIFEKLIGNMLIELAPWIDGQKSFSEIWNKPMDGIFKRNK